MRTNAWPGACHLYESTIDLKTDTRPHMSTENWTKPLFLIYYISVNLYSYWIPRVPFSAYPMILLFIQGLVVLADLATLICGCP